MSDAAPPLPEVRRAVAIALAEDLGVAGDITSAATVAESSRGVARFVAREEGVVAGVAFAAEVYRVVDAGLEVKWSLADGDPVVPGAEIGIVAGSLRSILAGERCALNFLSHCSGVATATRRFAEAVGPRCRVLDTRKTLPGLRAAQKAAVRAGGGHNHRDSLSDQVLIKDNHLSVLGITEAVTRARAMWPGRTVEVECDTLAQVEEAAAAGVDRIMLDNMTPAEVARAIEVIGGAAPVEVSGGVTLETAAAFAAAGADFVSVGALTHSARALDIGLDIGS